MVNILNAHLKKCKLDMMSEHLIYQNYLFSKFKAQTILYKAYLVNFKNHLNLIIFETSYLKIFNGN